MSSNQSRRDFLKLSSLGAAALAAAGTRPAFLAETAANDAAGEISVWVTDDDRRFTRASSIAWQPASSSMAPNTVLLHPDKKFQEILGFGGAFTDAACYTFSRLDPQSREQLFNQLFHPNQMRLNVCRTCIGSSDYSTKLYSYDEGEADPELSRFSIEHDRSYILPVLREARRANPELFLFSSPWSPPGWMKSNGSMLGG